MTQMTSQTPVIQQFFAYSETRRFAPLAIGMGFLIVVVCFVALSVFARDDGGAMDFLISEGARTRQSAARPPVYAPVAPQRAGFLPFFGQPTPQALPGDRPAQQPRRVASRSLDIEAAAHGKRSVCVRLCDGYFFPIGPVRNKSDLAGHEALCAGLCPGAPARLYVAPAGNDNIEDAVSTKDGKPYSALPVAFRHSGTADNTCTCRRPGQAHARLVSTYKDFTLRRGDSVMTKDGVKVFRGGKYPYSDKDFSALANDGALTNAQRGALKRLERAAAYNRARDEAAQGPEAIETASSPRLQRTLRPDHVQLVGERQTFLR